MSSIWQQVLALDARYNAYRTPNSPNFRTLYIRRRSQLLRENAKRDVDLSLQKQYLRLRAQLLSERYGTVISEGSIKSRSLSLRSGSQITLEGEIENNKKSSSNFLTAASPLNNATASTSLDASFADNYSFDEIHHVFSQHTGSVTRLRFAHDEKRRLAIASLDGTISICNLSDLKDESVVDFILKGHKSGVVDLAWSVSNDLLVSCSLDATLRLWDPNTGECIRVVEDNSAVLCCSFQPLNNNLVVTGNSKGLVQVLNISTGKYLKTSTCRTAGAAVCLCCDNGGRILWVGDDKGNVFSFIMELTSGKLVKARRMIIFNGSTITSLNARAWSRGDSKEPLLLINVTANMLCVYKYAILLNYDMKAGMNKQIIGGQIQQTDPTFFPERTADQLVVGSDGLIQLRKKVPLQHSRLNIRSNFCPLMSFRQGAIALSGSEDCCVYLFDVDKNTREVSCMKLKSHESPVIDVCFNHDETFLASGDSKGVVIVWKRDKNENV